MPSESPTEQRKAGLQQLLSRALIIAKELNDESLVSLLDSALSQCGPRRSGDHCALCGSAQCRYLVRCGGKCKRQFGLRCLTPCYFHQFVTQGDRWECRKCIYERQTCRCILRYVDPVDQILRDASLTDYRSSFFNVPFAEFACLKRIDFLFLDLPASSVPLLLRAIYRYFPSVLSSSPHDVNLLYFEPIPPSIPLTAMKLDESLQVVPPSSLIYASTSQSALLFLSPEDCSECVNRVRALQSRVHEGEDSDYPKVLVPRAAIAQKPFVNFAQRPSEKEMEEYGRDHSPKLRDRLRHRATYYLHPMQEHSTSSFGRFFSNPPVLKSIATVVQKHLFKDDLFIDMCCGTNEFAPLLKIDYRSYDIAPPKCNNCLEHFFRINWFDVKTLPEFCVIGLNPPFGSNGETAVLFYEHALRFRPRLLLAIVPYCVKYKLDVGSDYDLVYEDKMIVGGGSFYVGPRAAASAPQLPNDTKTRVAPDVNPHFFIWKYKGEISRLPGSAAYAAAGQGAAVARTSLSSDAHGGASHLKRRSTVESLLPSKSRRT